MDTYTGAMDECSTCFRQGRIVKIDDCIIVMHNPAGYFSVVMHGVRRSIPFRMPSAAFMAKIQEG